MRNLVLQQAAISLDGYICEEGTEFWRSFGPVALPPAPDDDEYEEYFLAGMSRAGTHIMGRVTYESMADTWPASTDPVAPLMNDTPKVVFSRSLQSAHWPESRIARGDMAEEIARLKTEPGGDILAHGGVRFVSLSSGLAWWTNTGSTCIRSRSAVAHHSFPILAAPKGCGCCRAGFSSVVCWRSHTGL